MSLKRYVVKALEDKLFSIIDSKAMKGFILTWKMF